MAKWGLLPTGAATTGSYDSDPTSSDEAEAPTPAIADRAEKMRRRLMQRLSGTPAASASLPSPALRATPTPPRNVVDLSPSPTTSPSRLPPPAPTENPSSKRPLEQSDAPQPKKI
ncbi:PREDICTED: classical arabinogalactan protein 9-like [Ipomoea nil]|uniref:classical arabinogalactan protein 9-like n=1 Tax=Ipomoea nil TaxID=35883 RepID=UPI00090156FD|nr:PREDICTED: classical arabinogalactan protein 9-like [Ipomoea nil]